MARASITARFVTSAEKARVRQDFFHCMKCNSCVSLVMGARVSRQKSSMSECPVCKEFMFDSETPLKTLPCGHLMHTSCFETYTRHYYTCPLCRKSLGDFTAHFRMLDAILATNKKNVQNEERRQKRRPRRRRRRRRKAKKTARQVQRLFGSDHGGFSFRLPRVREVSPRHNTVWNEWITDG